MKLRKSRVALVLFLIFAIIFTIFKVKTKNEKKQNENITSNKQVAYDDNIKIGISNLDTINPLKTKNKQMINLNQLIYEPLFTLDANYKLVPCLATEYAKTSSTTYVIKINNNIKWSNNTNISANDVKYTIELLKNTDGIYSENIKKIENAEVIDDTTLKINLTEETYLFEYNLIFPIMCQNYYASEDFFSSEKNAIGTGKYKISSYSGNQLILEKNENYRDQESVNKNIQKIYVNIYSEVGEVYNAFKIGGVDVIATSSSEYEKYIGTIGYNVKEYRGREYDFLSCNCNDSIMKEKNVRKAIALAIDKENIVSTIYNNKYFTSNYPLDYGNYVYEDTNSNIGYNQEKAKQTLKDAGWVYSKNRWRKNGKILTVTISTNSSNKKRCQVAQNIKEQLEAIGIQASVKEVSDAQYNAYLTNKNYQILLTGVYNSFSPDLTYFYGTNNIANYSNDEVKTIMKDINNITDYKLLLEKYKSLIEITKEDSAYISLYRNKNFLLINQKIVGNFEPTNYGIYKNFESWNKEK